jgi:hypothetical protein
MRLSYNSGRPQSAETEAARLRMLQQRGWQRLAGDRWMSPYTGICYDSRGAIDIEQLRGGWAKKMAAAFI